MNTFLTVSWTELGCITPKTPSHSHPMASWSFCLPVLLFFSQSLVKLFSRLKKKLKRLNKTLRWKHLQSVTASVDFSSFQMAPVHGTVERLCSGVYKSQPCETELQKTPGHLAWEDGIMSTGQGIMYRPQPGHLSFPFYQMLWKDEAMWWQVLVVMTVNSSEQATAPPNSKDSLAQQRWSEVAR